MDFLSTAQKKKASAETQEAGRSLIYNRLSNICFISLSIMPQLLRPLHNSGFVNWPQLFFKVLTNPQLW